MARAENTRAPSPSDRIWSRLFRAGPFYTRDPATARWPRVVTFVDCVARGARSAVGPRGAERERCRRRTRGAVYARCGRGPRFMYTVKITYTNLHLSLITYYTHYIQYIHGCDVSSQIKLQSLLDHTAEKILETKSIDELKTYQGKKLLLINKWGMDGSSGHSQYKQNFDESNSTTNDSNLFTISLVPINLSCNEEQIWQNPRPSSTRYCRPIKFEYAKETTKYVKQEDKKMQEQIKELQKTIATIKGQQFSIEHTGANNG